MRVDLANQAAREARKGCVDCRLRQHHAVDVVLHSVLATAAVRAEVAALVMFCQMKSLTVRVAALAQSAELCVALAASTGLHLYDN
mmetsp:Transcript_4721/g.14295  ORF Transcript_4721/g.14295 Transcript_4721/m.14295 type:complete len:86 (+) Transcript_4721:1098-1355(+)|eukprot:365693-Chlamydomonas_euryale.AAC.10